MTKTETRSDKLRAAHEKLTQAVESIVSGDDWKRMLKVGDPPSTRSGSEPALSSGLRRGIRPRTILRLLGREEAEREAALRKEKPPA